MGETRDHGEHHEMPADKLIARIMELVTEGNARAVRIQADNGKIHLEVPLTAGAVTGGVVVLAAPWLAILAAVAALVKRVRIEIIPRYPETTGSAPAADRPASR